MINKFTLLIVCFIALNFTAFAQTIETSKDGTVLVDGVKLFKVVQTKKMNVLTTEMPHFSIYDVNGTERIKMQHSKLLFEGSKSFIASDYVVDPRMKAIANFFGKDSIFTSTGYNKSYEEAFIKKHNGHFDSGVVAQKDEKGLVVRDKTQALAFKGSAISQADVIIGYTEHKSVEKSCTIKFAKEDKTVVAVAYYTCDIYKPQDINVTIEFADGSKDVKLAVRSLTWVEEEVGKLLVKNGYL